MANWEIEEMVKNGAPFEEILLACGVTSEEIEEISSENA